MDSPQSLIAVRKKAGMTQMQLGLAVFDAAAFRNRFSELATPKVQPSKKYLQKKISYWESGHARPNAEEVFALADVLNLEPRTIERWFLKSPSAAEELFHNLAETHHPSLVAVCYSGRPRAAIDESVFNALISGLQNQVSLAMYFPYPPAPVDRQRQARNQDLSDLYEDVWRNTRNHYQNLCSKLRSSKSEKQLALYVPHLPSTAPAVLIPPYAHRYTLIITHPEGADSEKWLYTWVESEKIDGLYRVGTFSNVAARPQVEAWQAYFGIPVNTWIKTKRLGDGGGFWKRVRLG